MSRYIISMSDEGKRRLANKLLDILPNRELHNLDEWCIDVINQINDKIKIKDEFCCSYCINNEYTKHGYSEWIGFDETDFILN